MKCTDCKYYNGTYQTNFSEYINCVKPNYKGIDAWKWVSSKVEKCKDFEPKEDSWEMTLQESQIISDIIEDIEKEIDKEYTDNLCDNQLIRAGYLGALCIIKNHMESVSK